MIIDDVQKERECQKVVGAEQQHKAFFLRVLLQAISFICSIIFWNGAGMKMELIFLFADFIDF